MMTLDQDIHYLEKYGDPKIFNENVEKLKQGFPVQYLVGNVDFYGYEFDVNPDVLIPRFETEELVSIVLEEIKKNPKEIVSILDMCTGSGCIGVTLKKEIPSSNVVAVDISPSALKVAKKNAEKLNAEVQFIESNLFENVTGKFDVIISNPPYISENEEIEEKVKKYEPSLALFAPNQGLYYYEKILNQSRKYVNHNFLIAFEIGYLQGERIKKLAKQYYPQSEVILKQDMQKRDRFIFIKGTN